MLPDEIIQMANYNKETIENAVGGTIKGITATSIVHASKELIDHRMIFFFRKKLVSEELVSVL